MEIIGFVSCGAAVEKKLGSETNTSSDSKIERGDEEEATEAYILVRRGDDDEVSEVKSMKANWYKIIDWTH